MSVDTADLADNAVTDAKISLDSVYTTWREDDVHKIVFKRQTVSFDPSIILHQGSYPHEPSVEVDIAAAENNVYVIYPQNYNFVAFKRSTDGGASFDGGLSLDQGWLAGLPRNPAIVASEYLADTELLAPGVPTNADDITTRIRSNAIDIFPVPLEYTIIQARKRKVTF